MESTRPDNLRGNKMDPQWKEANKTMGRQSYSDLQMLGVKNVEELANDR